MGDANHDRSFARSTSNDLLWHAVLSYVFTAIQNGDVALLQKIGIGAEQMRRLSAMSLGDFRHAFRNGDAVVQVRIDGARLDEMMHTIERESIRDQLVAQCIRLGAPLAMMRTCFKMQPAEFQSLQRRYGVSNPAGRPPHPRPEIAEQIYQTWESLGGRLSAGILVRTAEETGTSLSVVWRELIEHPQLKDPLLQAGGRRRGPRHEPASLGA